jgi:hypothetical protein
MKTQSQTNEWRITRTATLRPRDAMLDKMAMFAQTRAVRLVNETENSFFGFPCSWSILLTKTLRPMEYPKYAWEEVTV